MGDGFWNQPVPNYASATVIKRPRPEFDHHPPGASSSQDMVHYLPRDDAHIGLRAVKDTKSIGASYDRYLQNAKMSSFASGEASNYARAGLTRGVGGEMPSLRGGMRRLTIQEPVMVRDPGTVCPDHMADGRAMSFGGPFWVDPVGRPGPQGPVIQLPPDASNTLFVEGLPRDSTEREVAHIFRPFLGFKEVRLVSKGPKYHSGDSLLLCFVDFTNAACAMTALNALQGYQVDEHEPNSPFLRLQFARNPDPRSGPGSRSRR